MSFSTTKGAASTVIHRLAERGLLRYDDPVCAHWPEFAAGGKGTVTVRELLTHRAGLSSVQAVARQAEEMLDHELMEERLAARSVRAPTSRSAYHAITYGWLLSGLARRVTGQGMRALVQSELADTLGTDGLNIGAPDGASERIAQPVGSALRQIGSVTPVGLSAAVREPAGAHRLPGAARPRLSPAVSRLRATDLARGDARGQRAVQLRRPRAAVRRAGQRAAPSPADHGCSTPARYARSAAFSFAPVTSCSACRCAGGWAITRRSAPGDFAPRAFGHYGYGGSGGWADPQIGLSLGFVTNRIGSLTTPMGDLTLFRLNRVVRECAAAFLEA